MNTTGLRVALKKPMGEFLITPEDPDARPTLAAANAKALAALAGALALIRDLARDGGLTLAEFREGAELFATMAAQEPELTAIFLEALMKRAFAPEGAGVSDRTPDDIEGPFYFSGAPIIDNPGALPMRPGEPGTPLIVSGVIRGGDGAPLAGAELDIWMVALNGCYSQTGLDDQPDWNLRGRLHADAEGRYEFRTIKPVPYYMPVMPAIFEGVKAALGFSEFRSRHIHVKARHPSLTSEFTTQLYFSGDPYLPVDAITSGRAGLDALLLSTTRHEGPEGSAAGAYETATYDFVLA